MNTKMTANPETIGITAYFGQNAENAVYGYGNVDVYMITTWGNQDAAPLDRVSGEGLHHKVRRASGEVIVSDRHNKPNSEYNFKIVPVSEIKNILTHILIKSAKQYKKQRAA